MRAVSEAAWAAAGAGVPFATLSMGGRVDPDAPQEGAAYITPPRKQHGPCGNGSTPP